MKKSALLLAALALAVTATPALARTPEQVAEAALREAPVWDRHNDVPIQLRGRFANMMAISFHDTSDTSGDGGSWRGRTMRTDIARLRVGRVGAQFWSVYVSAALTEPEAVQATIEQVDVTKRLIAQNPRDLELALTAADVERAMKRGRIASLMGIEGGHSIGSSLAVLRQMHDLGVRYMTLTHSKNTPWADSADDVPMHGGLSEFGQQVVREMNRIGMIVDLSHVNAEAMNAALDIARAGDLAIRARSRSTEIRAMCATTCWRGSRVNGGIVMAIAYPAFVSEELRVWLANRKAEEARLGWLCSRGSRKRCRPGWISGTRPTPCPRDGGADGHSYRPYPARSRSSTASASAATMAAWPQVSRYGRRHRLSCAFSAGTGAAWPLRRADLKKIANVNMMQIMKAVRLTHGLAGAIPPIETPVP
ncbi:MAG: membrane dipeptidase [Sphingomonadaceae bacterium]